MGRYGPFPTAAGDGGGCLPLPIVATVGELAAVDGAIATAAFVQDKERRSTGHLCLIISLISVETG